MPNNTILLSIIDYFTNLDNNEFDMRTLASVIERDLADAMEYQDMQIINNNSKLYFLPKK